MGGSQSSIWIWHLWHIVFPVWIGLALRARHFRRAGTRMRPARDIAIAAASAVVLVLGFGVAVSRFSAALPVLIHTAREPMPPAFYAFGAFATAATAAPMLWAWWIGLRQRTVLHLWLAVMLTALLADVAASLTATPRYSFSWYFGRLEAIVAGTVLLVVLLGQVSRLHRRLGVAMGELELTNSQLQRQIDEKDALLVELQRAEQKVRELAYHDPLTGLPNRRLLLDRLHQAASLAQRHGHAMAAIYVDLNRFKPVNDRLGHDAGDELLRQTAARLAAAVRAGDTVARTGGDEFVVLLPEVAQPHDAERVAETIAQAFEAPFTVGGESLEVTASIGVAACRGEACGDGHALLKQADEAMYGAKRAGASRPAVHGLDGAVVARCEGMDRPPPGP